MSRIVETRPLPNGLVLEIRDESRRVAGDRHLVRLCFQVDVPIRMEFLEEIPQAEEKYREMRHEYGPSVRYELRLERNFIDEREVEGIRADMVGHFLKNNLAYLSRPDFAKRLVLRRWRELDQDPVRRFRKAQRALKEAEGNG